MTEWRCRATILDPSNKWRWVVSFMPRPLYSQWKNPRRSLDRRLGWLQRRSHIFVSCYFLNFTSIRSSQHYDSNPGTLPWDWDHDLRPGRSAERGRVARMVPYKFTSKPFENIFQDRPRVLCLHTGSRWRNMYILILVLFGIFPSCFTFNFLNPERTAASLAPRRYTSTTTIWNIFTSDTRHLAVAFQENWKMKDSYSLRRRPRPLEFYLLSVPSHIAVSSVTTNFTVFVTKLTSMLCI
jgi:hypothetical protein